MDPAAARGAGGRHPAGRCLSRRWPLPGGPRPAQAQPPPPVARALELSAFGLTESDLDRVFYSRLGGERSSTLRELIAVLRQTYCRTIGVEFMHIRDTAVRQWLLERMEPTRNRPAFDIRKKRRIIYKLNAAELFETFLHRNYVGQKRFSLEGGEMLIPLLDAIIERVGSQRGARDRHGDAAPRPAQRAGQHPRQALRHDLQRVRGERAARRSPATAT